MVELANVVIGEGAHFFRFRLPIVQTYLLSQKRGKYSIFARYSQDICETCTYLDISPSKNLQYVLWKLDS